MGDSDLDQIARLFRLHENGALSLSEFEAEKARILKQVEPSGATKNAVEDAATEEEQVETSGSFEAEILDALHFENDSPSASKWKALVALFLVILVGGGAIGWFALRGDRSVAGLLQFGATSQFNNEATTGQPDKLQRIPEPQAAIEAPSSETMPTDNMVGLPPDTAIANLIEGEPVTALTPSEIPTEFRGGWAPSRNECSAVSVESDGEPETLPSETRIDITKYGFDGFEDGGNLIKVIFSSPNQFIFSSRGAAVNGSAIETIKLQLGVDRLNIVRGGQMQRYQRCKP